MKFRNTSFRLALGLILPLVFAASASLHAQDAAKLSKEALQLQMDVKTLADDAMEGRKVGTKGEQKAADYLVKRFKSDKQRYIETHARLFARQGFSACC